MFITILLSFLCCDEENSPFAGQVKEFWFWFCGLPVRVVAMKGQAVCQLCYHDTSPGCFPFWWEYCNLLECWHDMSSLQLLYSQKINTRTPRVVGYSFSPSTIRSTTTLVVLGWYINTSGGGMHMQHLQGRCALQCFLMLLHHLILL